MFAEVRATSMHAHWTFGGGYRSAFPLLFEVMLVVFLFLMILMFQRFPTEPKQQLVVTMHLRHCSGRPSPVAL